MGVSHIMLVSQGEASMMLRIGKFPQGPTLFFGILNYALMKDVLAIQKKPRPPGSEYTTAPLLVLNNMPIESSHGKLLCSMLQGMFPTINTGKVRLAEIRRVVLFHYDREEDTVELRHYTIIVKQVGVSRSVKKIIRSEIQDLSTFADAAEYVLKAEANLSESEMEPDSVVTLGQNYHGEPDSKGSQRSINLYESGPRLTLKLFKMMEGLNKGKVFYRAALQKTQEEGSNHDETITDSDQDIHSDSNTEGVGSDDADE